MGNTPLKVCHFSSVHHQTDTRVFHRECTWLAKDFEVTLIAIGHFSGKKSGVHLIGIPKPTSRIKRIIHTTRKVYQEALKQQADIYHFHDPELIPYAWLLKLKGKKVVYDVHENVTESLKDKRWLPFKGLFIMMYLWFDRLAASAFSIVLAEQWYEKVYHRRYPNTHFTLVRNYAPAGLLSAFSTTQRYPLNGPLRIFYMGSIDELYCYKAMLEAIYLLNKNGLDTELKLIGWYSEQTMSSIEQLPYWSSIKNKIFMPGFMEVTEGYKHSLNCQMAFSFVSDNLNVSQSFPRKMYEYMHVGLPVVSSGHNLYKNMVETHALGLCVTHTTGAEIAEAVRNLLNSKTYLNQLAQNNLTAANTHFNWETEYTALKQLYFNLA